MESAAAPAATRRQALRLEHYLIGKDAASQIVQADAAIHSYTVAFWRSSTIFAIGAVVCGLILPAGKPEPADPDSVACVNVRSQAPWPRIRRPHIPVRWTRARGGRSGNRAVAL